jgi:hypothetical protein
MSTTTATLPETLARIAELEKLEGDYARTYDYTSDDLLGAGFFAGWTATAADLRAAYAERDALEPRAIRIAGWDGASRPIYRYADERHLPGYAQATPTTAEIAAARA